MHIPVWVAKRQWGKIKSTLDELLRLHSVRTGKGTGGDTIGQSAAGGAVWDKKGLTAEGKKPRSLPGDRAGVNHR